MGISILTFLKPFIAKLAPEILNPLEVAVGAWIKDNLPLMLKAGEDELVVILESGRGFIDNQLKANIKDTVLEQEIQATIDTIFTTLEVIVKAVKVVS